MNISGFPLLVKLTNLPAGSPSAGTDQEEVSIQENVVSSVIWQRWIACYMLYDWNLHHADSAYLSNKCGWVQQTYKRLEGTATDASSLKDTLTDTFNRILLEDVEDFIQTHMRVWKLTVEFQVAKVIAEIFSNPKS